MKTQPLVRVLTDAGYGSRRKVAALVKRGAVLVNGRLASSFMEPVDIDRDTVSVSGREVGLFQPRRIYLMMHKPMGILSTTEDDRGRQTVMDILPEKYWQAGLYPAGRLDEDSTGLLILTNDGDLTHELTHPRFEHEKEYAVSISRPLTADDLRRLENGVEIDGQLTWPARVHAIKESEEDEEYVYSITIHEGRKRQVRRMLQALGREIVSLTRVRMGSLVLGSLPQGETRELNDKELKALMRRSTVEAGPAAKPARVERAAARTPVAARRRMPTTRRDVPASSERSAVRPGGSGPGERPGPRPFVTRTTVSSCEGTPTRAPRPDGTRRAAPSGRGAGTSAADPGAPVRGPGRPMRPRSGAPAGKTAGHRRTVERPIQARFDTGRSAGAGRRGGSPSPGHAAADRPWRVDRTPAGAPDYEGRVGLPRRERPTAPGTAVRPLRKTSGAGARRGQSQDTDARRARPPRPAQSAGQRGPARNGEERKERPARPRGQVSRQRPGASQQRRQQEQRGPSRPRRTSPAEGRTPRAAHR